MSITFADPSNPARYNEDGDQIGGGSDVNFNNSNAFHILLILGLCKAENPELYGTVDGNTFRKCCIKALVIIDIFKPNYSYLKEKINRLLTVFADCEQVTWG